MAKLEPGDKAPAFSLKDQNGKTVKLGSFKGKKLLVYFYPRANTSGCTKQACSVRDSERPLKKLKVATVASPDKSAARAIVGWVPVSGLSSRVSIPLTICTFPEVGPVPAASSSIQPPRQTSLPLLLLKEAISKPSLNVFKAPLCST